MWTPLLAAAFLPLLSSRQDECRCDVIATICVIADVTSFLEWQTAVLVYDESMSRTERRCLVSQLADRRIGTVQLHLPSSVEAVTARRLSAIQQNTTAKSVLLFVHSTSRVLKQANALQMLQQNYEWLVVIDIEQLQAVEDMLHGKLFNVALLLQVGVSSLDQILEKENAQPSASRCSAVDFQTKRDLEQVDGRWLQTFIVCRYDWQTEAFHLAATWTPSLGLQLLVDVIFPFRFDNFNNATLRIATWEAIPFTKRLSNNGTMNYTGFCIAILDEMARYLNFNYVMVEPLDGQYGTPENGSWNGMVGMLLRGELHMAVGPFSITLDRKAVVDFTPPFMEDGGGILTKNNDREPDLLSTFRPFSVTVWLAMALAIVTTALVLFVITKYRNWQGCKEPCAQRQWAFTDCLLLMFGSLMFQGANRHPVSSAGRVVLGCWWLFTILIVSIYTASLAALLTVHVHGNKVDSIQDLVHSSLDPVTIVGTNWWTLFMLEKEKSGMYEAVSKRMQQTPELRLVEEAVNLVQSGTAAYISDVNQIRYLYGQDCQNLYMSRNIFSQNGLGFALPRGAIYKEAINFIILRLQESGIMDIWKRQWWRKSSRCFQEHLSGAASVVETEQRLGVVALGGILLLYGSVIVLASVCCILQWARCSSLFRDICKKLVHGRLCPWKKGKMIVNKD